MLVELKGGDLDVAVVDNADHAETDGHRAGYNGLAWLKHSARPANLFVPTYAGLNLELYFDGVEDQRERLFEPRRAPMTVRRIDALTAELHQPPTPVWHVESWTTFRLVPPHAIDFHYRAIPRAATFRHGWMGVFWASYIERPEDLGINFVAADESRGERWIRHYSPVHGVESTHRHRDDRLEIHSKPPHTMYMYASMSPWRYARPYYYGVSHGMMCLFMVEDTPLVRFTQSPSGGGSGCPAWDYQLIVPDYRADHEYSLRARLVYKPLTHHDDIAAEYARWCAERQGDG